MANAILERVGLEHELEVSVVRDSTVAAIMSGVDFVLIGAEGVVESGGIINTVSPSAVSATREREKGGNASTDIIVTWQGCTHLVGANSFEACLVGVRPAHPTWLQVGTFQIAVVAKALGKPVYVAARALLCYRTAAASWAPRPDPAGAPISAPHPLRGLQGAVAKHWAQWSPTSSSGTTRWPSPTSSSPPT